MFGWLSVAAARASRRSLALGARRVMKKNEIALSATVRPRPAGYCSVAMTAEHAPNLVLSERLPDQRRPGPIRQLDQSNGVGRRRFHERAGGLVRREQRLELGPQGRVAGARDVEKRPAVSRRALQGAVKQFGDLDHDGLPCISRRSQALANVQ